MATAFCAALTRDGAPCRAHARQGRRFCPFHDPACAPSLTSGRSKGGGTPRRRRPAPRLDAAAVADLLHRHLVAALESPQLHDAASLQALANLAPVLLQLIDRLPDARGPRAGRGVGTEQTHGPISFKPLNRSADRH